jgi:hypothetical protein
MRVTIPLVIALLLASCKTSEECPTVGETKCENNQIWLCNKSGNWDKTDDCAELSALNSMQLICWPPTPEYPAAACLPPEIQVDDAGIPNEDALSMDEDAGVSDDVDVLEDSAIIQDADMVDVTEDAND